MNYRELGRTGMKVSEISLGTWQLGGGWGKPFDDKKAEAIIHEAIDSGINFIDTADIYSEGKSEAAVGRVVRSRPEQVYLATKCGGKIVPRLPENYTPEKMRRFVEESLKNTGFETLDLIQLHCPPTEVFYRPEIFEVFDRLRDEGKIRHFGVSVEKTEEALKAMEFPNVRTVQIIFNMFRHRPSELFFREAARKEIGIIVRVPLASGLLSGKYSKNTRFEKEDHRTFNRDGKAFDKGETFSGVPYELGLKAVEKIKSVLPDSYPLSALALRWILMFPEVSCVIPGTSRSEQLKQNIESAELPALTEDQMEGVRQVYAEYIKPSVHNLW